MTYGVVAQMVEHLLLRLQKGGDSSTPHPTSHGGSSFGGALAASAQREGEGSNPSRRTPHPGSSMVEQPPSNRKVAGSSPVRGTS